MKQDVTILYQGGSGGFALFYYLLLSGHYHAGLEYDSVHDLIKQQFPYSLIDSPTAWKQKEFWPDNDLCKSSPIGPRLFLICNPMWPDSVVNNLKIRADNHCILLYADFKLHLRMAWEKKAYWFTDVTKQAVRAPVETKTYLKQIINTQVNNLDPMVPLIEKMFRPEQKVNLKQFVQSKMLDGFDPPNSAQLEFLDRWNSIQPKKVKRVLSSK